MHYFVFSDKMVIFLCHSAICSVAARLLFPGGMGAFLPHALCWPIWCHFPGRSKVKLYERTLGAMGSHDNTVSIQKNSRMAI